MSLGQKSTEDKSKNSQYYSTMIAYIFEEKYMLDLKLTPVCASDKEVTIFFLMKLNNKVLMNTLLSKHSHELSQIKTEKFLKNYKLNLTYRFEDVIFELCKSNEKSLIEFFFKNFKLSEMNFYFAMETAILCENMKVVRQLASLKKNQLIKKITINGESIIGLRKTYILFFLFNL